MTTRRIFSTALASSLGMPSVRLFAQEAPEVFPKRPVTWIVAYPAGGSIDSVARVVAKRLAEVLGQPVIIDNRGGAGGRLGGQVVANAKADGYTQLLTLNTSYTIGKELYTNLNFDPAKDFRLASILATSSQLLITSPALPARNLKELVALAKARPGELTFASTGPGGSLHLAMLYLQTMTGMELTHIPYKGGPGATTDLIAGRVDMMFLNTPAALPFVKARSVRALAVSTAQRTPELPEVPTIAESGVPGFDLPVWFGLSVPTATPQATVELMSTAIQKVVDEPAVRNSIERLGAQALGGTPQEATKRAEVESALWTQTFKKNGMKLE